MDGGFQGVVEGQSGVAGGTVDGPGRIQPDAFRDEDIAGQQRGDGAAVF